MCAEKTCGVASLVAAVGVGGDEHSLEWLLVAVDVYPFPCAWGWELESTGSHRGWGAYTCPVQKCNFIISM